MLQCLRMGYSLSTDDLREKFGNLVLELIYHKENKRTSCVRRLSDNAALAYSYVAFFNEGILALGKELHDQIVSGKSIGEVIRDSGVLHERTESKNFSSKVNLGLSFLFDTRKDYCLSRKVDYKIKGTSYASIVEFYNPEYLSIEDSNPRQDNIGIEDYLIIDRLKPGFEEKYLALAHGFLKKQMHLGIEDQDTFIEKTRETLNLLTSDTNTRLFVAANQREFIGYIAINIHPALHINGLECVARELYVKDEYQRKGIGTALMAYIERYAAKLGCKRISLATNLENEVQKAFYENIGFSKRCDFLTKRLTD